MDLERVIAALAPTAVANRAPVEVRDLAYDAREVGPGALFFAYPGAKADGHDFAADAVQRGAAALVCERELPLVVPQVVVTDARRAMPVVAAEFFAAPSRELDIVGVTGTNGKTTTSYLVHAILAYAGLRPGLLGNIERIVGDEHLPAVLNTPEAIDLQRLLRAMVDAGNSTAVLEASSEASAQGRLDETRFAALVFTNLTQDHLNFHGTMEAYFDAKRRLFAQADRAAVNVGDPYGRRLAEELPEALRFGFSDDAEIGPSALEGLPLKLRGRFNEENALAAIAAARLLDVEADAIAAGIASVSGVPGRFEEVDEGQAFTVLVDYAHTPDSLANVLRAARDIAPGRVICVFGAGGDRDREKRPLMGKTVRELSDVVVVTSDNPRGEDPAAIIEDILGGIAGDPDVVDLDRAAAIARALELAGAGDVVVLAGKGHEQGQEVDGRKIPFDDRLVAREALRRLGAGR